MKLSDIIAQEDGLRIHCYKQGVFWVAYEASAYAVWQLTAYKATKKQVKVVNQEVVSLGFPDKAFAQWSAPYTLADTSTVHHKILLLPDPIDTVAYLEWKANLPLTEHKKPKATQQQEPSSAAMHHQPATEEGMLFYSPRFYASIIEQIRYYPLANSTPIQAFLFLQQLQSQLAINN